jgi:glycerate 2-kinase
MGLLKTDCFNLIKHAIDAINPEKLIRKNLKLVNSDCLLVDNKIRYELNHNVYVAAFGKAVLGMCTEIEHILGKHLVRGIAILPAGLRNNVSQSEHAKIEYMFGANNNMPDQGSYVAAAKLFAMCETLCDKDLLIALISGGGSALLSLPIDGVTLADKISVTKLVAASGASINELNMIRMGLSKTKAGGLAKAVHPARILSLIISDVLGDPIEIIASGPTCISHLQQANVEMRKSESLNIIQKYKLENKIPSNVLKQFKDQMDSGISKQQTDQLLVSTHNTIIGTNKIATQAIKDQALVLGYDPVVILTNSLSGEARDCGLIFAYLAFILSDLNNYQQNQEFFKSSLEKDLTPGHVNVLNKFLNICQTRLGDQKAAGKLCVLSGGETTVNLLDGNGNFSSGLGGRNQELTLAFKKKFSELLNVRDVSTKTQVLFTSFGTDGIDGPTDAAGAFAFFPTESTVSNDTEAMTKCLKEHNSYAYFNGTENHIKVGHTGTNVSDLQILLISSS